MKKFVLCIMVMVVLTGPSALRADDKDVFWGALLGAGTGLILGETVDGVHASVAVPIGAIAGGVIGSEMERMSRHHSSRDGYLYGYRYPHTRVYGGHGRHERVMPYRVIQVVAPKEAKEAPTTPPVVEPNYQPGVEVVKVEIKLVTGAPMDVRLLRMPDGTFVGPQGEKYTTLPKVAELARYSGVKIDPPLKKGRAAGDGTRRPE